MELAKVLFLTKTVTHDELGVKIQYSHMTIRKHERVVTIL
jgi:hypothetical protein